MLGHRTNWGSTVDVCSWAGIHCEYIDGGRHVTFVDFNKYNMRCELPASMASLVYLHTFDVSGLLIGTVPSAIRGWRRLQVLKLYENELTGTLPSWLSELRKLREIAIVPARGFLPGLSGTIPDSLGTLPLQRLVLDSNSLTGVVPAWAIAVTFVQMRGNMFTGPCPNNGIEHIVERKTGVFMTLLLRGDRGGGWT